MKRVSSVLSAMVILFAMAVPVMARQNTVQAHSSSSRAASAKHEKSAHEATNSTRKAAVGHAGNNSRQMQKTRKKG
jgi:hypothetical protein